MILTKTAVTAIINYGINEQSPEAIKYINAVREKTGIEIVCCYASESQFLELPKKPYEEINESNTCLINQLQLEIYIRATHQETSIKSSEYKQILLSIFFDTMGLSADSVEYQRYLTPDEMKFYGFLGKKRSEWDESKIIYPINPPTYSCEVDIQSFSCLAVYHYLSKGQKAANKLPSIVALGAKVYCGWDEEHACMTYYVILTESKMKVLTNLERDTVTNEVCSLLQKYDKNDVISSMPFKLIFITWEKLSPAIRFNLLRG